MILNKKRYSHLIRPLFLLVDLFIINSVVFYISDKEFVNLRFLVYINILWIVISIYSGFYKVYRFTNYFRLFTLLAVQFILFFLVYFAYFGVFKEGQIVNNQLLIFISIFIGVTILKFFSFNINPFIPLSIISLFPLPFKVTTANLEAIASRITKPKGS